MGTCSCAGMDGGVVGCGVGYGAHDFAGVTHTSHLSPLSDRSGGQSG